MVLNHFYRRLGKRLLDLAIAVPVLIVLSPVLAITAVLVRIWLGSPVLFRQERPGLHGRRFFICKFRTMTDERDATGRLLSDERRLTRLGRLIRGTSLDELPQLWNVFRGDMSLVGPRPLLVEYLERYTPEHQQRHDVLPGVTGWAQVNGRQDILFSRRLDLDVWYVNHLTLAFDLKVLWLTVIKLFSGQGVRSGQDVRAVDDLGLNDETFRPAGEEVPHADVGSRRAA